MKSFRTIGMWLLVTTIASGGMFAAQGRPVRQSKADPRVVAKLAQMLEQSGYTYRKAAENVWVVNFKGKSLPEIDVFVTSAQDLIVMGAVVAPKRSIKVTPE